MKKYAILTLCLFLSSLAFAQRKPTKIQVQKQPTMVYTNHGKILQAVAPDLAPHPPAIHTSNGKRYIQAFTVNHGKAASKSCYLKVTYKWKFDYELFTQKEIVKQYTIKPLEPNTGTSVIFQVPDDQISSNPPYGSTNMSIKLEVDGTNLVIESDEHNNIKYLSLIILN